MRIVDFYGVCLCHKPKLECRFIIVHWHNDSARSYSKSHLNHAHNIREAISIRLRLEHRQ